MVEGRALAEPPEEVVRRVIAALNAGNWELVAESADAESLERFRRFELAVLRAQMGRPPSTPEELTGAIPGAAEAVLQWLMDEDAAAVARKREWPAGLMGVVDVDDLAVLPAPDLFIRWLAASFGGTIPWQLAPPQPPRLNRRVVGSTREVRDGDLLAYVVYARADDPRRGAPVTLTTVRSTPAGWRIDATDTQLLLPAG
jgi:hypothetical protein